MPTKPPPLTDEQIRDWLTRLGKEIDQRCGENARAVQAVRQLLEAANPPPKLEQE
jgi:hypothetical protein